MTPSALSARGDQRSIHTRETIIEALQAYAAAYGPGFSSAAFAPATARRAGHQELVDRYEAGNPRTGAPWPSLNTIKSRFEDSFTEARLAAGLPANRSGPQRTRESSVSHAPSAQRDWAAVARAQERVERAEVRRDRAIERAALAEARLRELRAKTKPTVDRTALDAARSRATEARASATRAAAKLERAEAMINTLRADKRALRADVDKLERALGAAAADVRVVEVPVEVIKVVTKIVERAAPAEAVLDAAKAAERAARDRERAALGRARASDEAYLALVEVVNGARRRLTAAELAVLRVSGLSGPAVMADALKALAKARAKGGRQAQSEALVRVASAAVSWRERL